MKQDNIQNAVDADLEGRIKKAETALQIKKNTVEQAQQDMDQAKNELNELKHQRDVKYITSLQGKTDWELVFNYNPDETAYIYDYRESILAAYGLNKTGHYHSETLQHIFNIAFETNSLDERQKIKEKVELILSHLKFNPKDNTKSIFIENIRNDELGQWELLVSGSDGNYSLLKTNYSSGRFELKFESLDALLEKVQSLSDVAFEALAE